MQFHLLGFSKRQFHRWLVRSLITLLLFNTILPPPPRASLGDPQTVHTLKPQMCVHTRLIEEVDEWKIQRSLQYVREMGADTIVEFFPWAYVEAVEDQYDWHGVDRIVRHAENQGIHIIARMGFVPAWARPDEAQEFTTFNTLDPDAYDDFADFVADFAVRYAGVIDHLIIWNEPNLAFEWGYRQVDAAAYARLLEAVYPVAHQANPNVIILAAPLAPTLEPAGSANGLSDILYLESLYQAGASDYFDALAVHTYGFNQPPEAPPAFDTLNFRRAELLHEIMLRYDEEKPVYITETGWNDSPRWTRGITPSQRVDYTLRAFEWAENSWEWLDKLCVWVLRYPAPTYSYPDYFTLVGVDFQRKPIYYALQAYARGLSMSEDLWLPAP
jgi:hypothetical protein